MTFGTWPNRSVITARDEAKRLERDIDRGQDPMDASISARRALTVNWLVERYIAEHLPKLPASSAKDRVSMVKTLVLHDYVMQVSMKSSHHGFFEGEPRIRPSHFRQSTSQDRSWASCRPRADFASVTSAIAAALKAPYSLIMRYKGKKGAEPRKRTVMPLGTRP